MDKKLQDSLSKIKLFICDIDGVLTDGSFIKSTSGDELRSFNALDGVGFVMLRLLNLNIKTAWITGRESLTTTQRAEELQIDDVYNGVIRKIDAYDELKKKYGVLDNEVCFIGDDIIEPRMDRYNSPLPLFLTISPYSLPSL
jgi:3-deoxy-D-manno-octulosonate 8-phosphate phosphatase (KDO 8-P phosphatase)